MKPIDEKISAFLKRYLKTPSPEEMEAACERNLQKLLDSVNAMEEAKATTEEEPIEKLKPVEYLVLTAAYLLRGDGYTLTIAHKVKEMSDDVEYGTVVATLFEMQGRGLVVLRRGDPTPERGGRYKSFFTVTATGERALAHAREDREAAPGFLRGWI